MSFRCAVCGEEHDELPDVGSDRPDHWWGVPEAEREARIVLDEDTCIIDDEHYFIRGVIELPVAAYPAGFGFGVWVSQKRENFETYRAHFDAADIGPFFGWLCTRIACYETDTSLLRTVAHFRGGGLRPRIVLEPCDHPLSRDQCHGISLERAWEFVHFYDTP